MGDQLRIRHISNEDVKKRVAFFNQITTTQIVVSDQNNLIHILELVLYIKYYAEMSAKNLKLPLELELEKRYRHGIDFYTDYVAEKIKREDYANEKDHLKAMQTEGQNLSYTYGYGEGWNWDANMFGHDLW